MSEFLSPSNRGAKALLPDTSENEFGSLRWLTWWYHLSLPPKPEESASFRIRDIYRKARLASILLFLLLTIMISSTLISAVSRNIPAMTATGIVTIVLIIALLLNRVGLVIIEGVLIVGLWTIGVVFSFLALPAIDIGNVIQYDLLTVAILLAITFFPAWSVFVVTLFNCVFIWYSITHLKTTPQLAQLIIHDGGIGKVALRPISLMLVIMVVTYLWARSSYFALQRADRAETIAKLQYDLSERDQVIAVQKVQLEHSVQRISDTLTSYSNGNAAARVPLTQDNVLWNIAGPINNLLNRVQRMRHAEAELERLRPLLQRARQIEQENVMLRTTLQKQRETESPRQQHENSPARPFPGQRSTQTPLDTNR